MNFIEAARREFKHPDYPTVKEWLQAFAVIAAVCFIDAILDGRAF